MKLAAFFRISEQDAGRLLKDVPGDLMVDLPRAVLEHVQG
jgi:hypothetical protein